MDDDFSRFFHICLARSLEWSQTKISQTEGQLDVSDVHQAMHLLSYALRDASLWPIARSLVLALVPKMERDGWREELRAVLDAALARSNELSDLEAEADLHWHLGVLLHLQASYADARTHLESSAAQYGHLNAGRHQGRALTRLASVARWQRHLDEAEGLIVVAGKLMDQADSEYAYLLSVQGQIALDRHEWSNAELTFERALRLASTNQDMRLIAWLWVNLGMAMWKQERHQDAIRCYLKAIQMFSLINDPVHTAVAQMDLGIIYAMGNDPTAALAQYALAEPVFRQTADINRQAMLYNNIGYVHHILLQQWAEAEHFYQLSIERASVIGNIYEMCNAIDNLGLAYTAQGRNHDAEVVFATALDELAKMEQNPDCQLLRDEVAAHLDQAKRRSTAASNSALRVVSGSG